MNTHKSCSFCKHTLPVESFSIIHRRGRVELKSRCKACHYKIVSASRSRRRNDYNAWQRDNHQKTKLKVLSHYSNNTLECACCGEKEYAFLSLDHIGGGGAKHRRSLKSNFAIYRLLIRSGFPSGYQVLCMNCNFAEGQGGCPHRLKLEAAMKIALSGTLDPLIRAESVTTNER